MIRIRLKRFFTQAPVWQSIAIVLLLLFGDLALIYFRIHPSDKLLILHYTIPFGIDLVGPWYRLYEIPIAGAVIALVNFILAYVFYTKQRYVATTVIIATVLLEIMIATGLYLIISQNAT